MNHQWKNGGDRLDQRVSEARQQQQYKQREHEQSPRFLSDLGENTDGFSIDDDGVRDSICQGYLMNFLNGTTDSKDECSGMMNAYLEADCADDSNMLHPVHHHKQKRQDKGNVLDDDDDNTNGANTDDTNSGSSTDDTADGMIDDYVEAYQCCYNIHQYYTKHCEETDLASMRLLGITLVLVLCGLLKR